MNWLKEKIKRFKRWIIGLFIPFALAAPLAAIPPEDTTYKLEWKEAFSSEQLMNDTLANHPEQFPNISFLGTSGSRHGYSEILLYREFAASTTQKAVEQSKQLEYVRRKGSSLQAKTLLGNYVEKRETGQIDKEPIAMSSYFMSTALAAYPTEDFESYTSGNDLNTGAGGSGWSENWGATTACGTSIDTLNTPTLEGGITGGGSQAGTDVCRRNFTAETTDDNVISFIVRSGQTSVANDWGPYLFIRRGTADGSLILNCYEDGNTKTYDNTTFTTIAACSANTNYTVKITVKPSTEEHRINFNGTEYPSASTYFFLQGYTTNDYTPGLDNFFLGDPPGTPEMYFDDIKDATPVAVIPQKDLHDSTWFQILFEWLIQKVYAKTSSTN